MSDPRALYIKGLRELATFLEEHPELPHPPCPSTQLVTVDTKAELAAIARVSGVRWDKDFQSEHYFALKTAFHGDVVYGVFIERSQVCEKHSLGTKLIPATPEHEVENFRWVCNDEPLLASPETV